MLKPCINTKKSPAWIRGELIIFSGLKKQSPRYGGEKLPVLAKSPVFDTHLVAGKKIFF